MQSDHERPVLKAILFADLHQSSRHVAHNEIGTLSFLQECFGIFRDRCRKFGGEFIKTTGDGVLILFDSAVSAVDFAVESQTELEASQTDGANARQFRIGLHMGEVYRGSGDVFGHAINVAARIEGLAEPGNICVSQEVYRAAHQGSAYGFVSGGRVTLRNIPDPLSIYHLRPNGRPAKGHDAGDFHIATIDGFSLTADDAEPLPLRSQKARALIGFLALSNKFRENQDRIITLLWPDRSRLEGRRALMSCLANIEKALAPVGPDLIVRQGDFIGLNGAWVDVDLPMILENLASGKIDALLLEKPNWPQTILFGLEQVSPLFNSWLKVTRRNWGERVSELLEAMLDRFEVGEPLMKQAATALLVAEPCHEHAAQCLIRHHAKTGNQAAALRVYDALCREMEAKFSLQPGTDIVNLIRGLNGMHSPSVKEVPSDGARVRRPTIAVGDVTARCDSLLDPAFGFRADLISNLSRFREWTIIEGRSDARSSGADYFISGSCSEVLGEIELHLLLVRPDSGHVVWSEMFHFAAGNWAETQRKIISRIASSLEVYVSHDRLSRILPEQAGQNVYDLWIRGEHLLTHWKPKSEAEAMALFSEVIEKDPEFAPAYASLASVYSSRHFVWPGSAPDPALTRRALDLANRSIDLDPLSARGQLTVAWASAKADQFSQAEVHFELAVELNPNSPKTLLSAALGLAFMGRTDAGKLLLDRAVVLSPIFLDYQWSYIAAIRYLVGDFAGAVDAANRSKNVIVDTPGWAAAAHLQLGQAVEGAAALREMQKIVSAEWYGSQEASIEAVLDWYLAGFPIRREEDRRQLARLRELI
jgi:class 3 adenylate cyclase/DNA-binding SARP family transcriptional activator/tetratricopeptide (TPR) repeat protein